MHRIKYRIILPVLFGLLSLILIIWDLHNERIIMSMGMAWDTGAPLWPYQASWRLFSAINAPAVVISFPIVFLLDLQTVFGRYPIQYLLILFVWYWIGTRLDRGILGNRNYRNPKLLAVLLVVVALTLLCISILNLWKHASIWFEYRRYIPSGIWLWLPEAGVLLWCLVLTTGAIIAASRLIKSNNQIAEQPKSGFSRLKAVIIALAVLAAILIGKVLESHNL